MLHTVTKNKDGLTLVEVMIASVIILILFLALMQSVLLSINMNVKNQLRDTAVNVAEERMRELRGLDFDTLASVTDQDDGAVVRNFRNIPPRSFNRRHTIAGLGTDMKSIAVTVSYLDVKDNRCSITTGTECVSDDDCDEGETCGVTQTITSILRRGD